MLRSALATLALTVALGGSLCACAADEPEPTAPVTPSASETPVAEPTEVPFGDAESVTWEPTNNLTTELSIQVDRVREGRFADFKDLVASGITEANQPFYVDVVIANGGEPEIGGLDVPLYLVDSAQVLSPPSKFATTFEPCPSGPLPTSFGAGEKAEMCLVFFSSPSADFQSITFQPDLETAAVSWTGDVDVPAKEPKPGQDRKKKRR
ncbi:MAG: hypothetical protein JWN68_121 [Nocardioides sp.]|jgi:hypothetical protein|uniref:hypothetical protein n=1 Tax=Nocardioides sp. TaxID=35761 RepID=UPI00262818A5|nr:hypothetical protein [Nocardioides sp.]MCW2832168.1 hypothetical protein [Nocardioides sp.]